MSANNIAHLRQVKAIASIKLAIALESRDIDNKINELKDCAKAFLECSDKKYVTSEGAHNMFTIYIKNGNAWQFECSTKVASIAATVARMWHDKGYKVSIDSPEVPVERDEYD